MAKGNHQFGVRLSLLDRLIDDEPDKKEERQPSSFESLRQFKRGVIRDLENLLNTRMELLEGAPSHLREVEQSLKTYGLQDFTSCNLMSEHDRAWVKRALERAIAAFEPRLERVRLSVEQNGEEHGSTIRFRIDGYLRTDPEPEPVTFDAVLEPGTQQYIVQSRG